MGEIKFEKAIQRLEKIVDDLETGELDIDKSLEIFEEGIIEAAKVVIYSGIWITYMQQSKRVAGTFVE